MVQGGQVQGTGCSVQKYGSAGCTEKKQSPITSYQSLLAVGHRVLAAEDLGDEHGQG